MRVTVHDIKRRNDRRRQNKRWIWRKTGLGVFILALRKINTNSKWEDALSKYSRL